MRRLKNGILILIWLSFALLIKAQPQLPPVENFSPRDYGDGQVPENYAICKDARGFIYSANIGGLLQFDGHDWKFIEVETGVKVNAVSYSGNHRIACGGLNMMGIVEPDKGGAMKFRSLVPLLPDTLKNFEITTIQSAGGKIFFQSKFVLFVYEDAKLKPIFPINSFFRSYSCENRVFVRDREIGLMEWKNGKFELFASDTLSKYWGYFGMVSYDKNHFLLAEHELGFYLMNKKTGAIQQLSGFFYEDFRPKIYDLKKMDHDLFALATINHGVIILDKDLELKARIGKNDGLKSSFVNQITSDNYGNIWAATSAGVSFIDIHSPLHFYGEISGLPGNVESIQFLGSHFYAGSSDGLFILPQSYSDDQKPWRKVNEINSMVNALDVNGKDVLVASGNGLYVGTLQTFRKIGDGNFHTVKFIPGIKTIIALDPDYLHIYDNNYILTEKIPLEFHVQRIHSVAIDTSVAGRTRIWVGLSNQGVLQLDILKSGEIKTDIFNKDDGLMPGIVKPYNFIGKIIFLTENGFQHFISEEEFSSELTEEEKADPMINRGYFDVFRIPGKEIKGKISSMCLDNGRIYLILNDRLCYYDEHGKKHQKEFSTLNLGRLNDLICFRNQLWVAASEGTARFSPFHFKKINQTFEIYFRKIYGDEDNIYMDDFFESEKGFNAVQDVNLIPEIDYSDNSLTFRFSTNYFDHTHKMEYSYYLEGSGGDWSKWSSENKITFNHLQEGEYVLNIRAKNVYGIESNQTVFRFVVLPPWYRTWWAYVMYVILAIIIVFITIRIAVYRLKQNNIRLEKIVQERTVEIANKNEELQEQNHQITHQKQEITDSINYARRIQEAILPVKKEIKRVFPDSFVLFKPKDIVSGDFYWFANQDQLSIFICADCTGHGVPGAFMSMICTDRLNHTVLEKKIKTPSAMLMEVNQGIKRSLKQEDESDLKTKDGMDAAVCSFNHQTSELIYAGANRPLWLLRKGELLEYKPTKMAVGGFTPEEQNFDETVINIEKGDVVYLSTDGYADQFGGPKGKKLMVKSFKELLVGISSLPFDEQHDKLDKFIENWRHTKTGESDFIEQVDDMCIIGIKF